MYTKISQYNDGYGGVKYMAQVLQDSRTGIRDEVEIDLITAKHFNTQRGAEKWLLKLGYK